jgi:hypothetical protein
MTFLQNICHNLEKVVDCLKSVSRSSWTRKISGLLPALRVNNLELDLSMKMIKSLLYTVVHQAQYSMLLYRTRH